MTVVANSSDTQVRRVAEALALCPETAQTLVALSRIEKLREFTLPPPSEIAALLDALEVPQPFADDIVAAAPDPVTTPEAWWLLERLHHQLLADDFEPSAPWPTPRRGDQGLINYFQLYPLLAAIPEARRRHAALGIPESVSWDTFSDIGIHVRDVRPFPEITTEAGS